MTDANGRIEQSSVERDFPQAFADYRRMEWRGFAIQLAYIAVGCLLIFLQAHFTHRFELSFLMLLVLAGVGSAMAGGPLRKWVCPRCHKLFHEDGKNIGPRQRQCVHCGLRLRASEWM